MRLLIKNIEMLSFYNAIKSKLKIPVRIDIGQQSYTSPFQRNEPNPVVKKLLSGLLSGSRSSLAESITLVETTNLKQRLIAKNLMNSVLYLKSRDKDKYKDSLRIGLSGPPGAGKSTFIEAFGKYLTNKHFKVAVLAVDPSSSTTGGSILGDKTRMPELSRDINAYIRPSPSRGHLGGVTRSTNEAIVLCETAGYDIIIIETVGVGQSEYAVSDMVDLFALLLPPASGDELQGIKKGIMELSDILIVNKADGDLLPAARMVYYEYLSALKFIKRRNKNWKPVVKLVSSVHNEGIEDLWNVMMNFWTTLKSSGDLEQKRMEQQKTWMWTHLQDSLMTTFLQNPTVSDKVKEYEVLVMEGRVTPGDAADSILEYIIESFKK